MLIDTLYEMLFGDNLTGKLGELFTAKELKWVQLFGRNGKILHNVYIPKDNGETSEIDVLFITQNATHIKWLGNYIGSEIPLFSIIVFSERCELKKVTVTNPDIKVIKRDRTYATVRNIWDKSEDRLSDSEVEELYRKLQSLTNVSKEQKDLHVQQIKEKYDAPTRKEVVSTETVKEACEAAGKVMEPVDGKMCPRCGNKLVLRTAKRGDNAGKQFWGCSGFPKCRYVETK